MKLSFAERMFINSPIRGLSLRVVEPRIFQSLAPFPQGAHVLDLGCGNGTGLVSIAHHHAPASLTGIDVDAEQLERARKRLARAGVTARLIEATAESITLPAHTYDVITANGCLHRVPQWPAALSEVARLLRHGGLLYLFEVYNPLRRATFSHQRLLQELSAHGLTPLAHKNLFGLFGFIVARRTGSPNQYD